MKENAESLKAIALTETNSGNQGHLMFSPVSNRVKTWKADKSNTQNWCLVNIDVLSISCKYSCHFKYRTTSDILILQESIVHFLKHYWNEIKIKQNQLRWCLLAWKIRRLPHFCLISKFWILCLFKITCHYLMIFFNSKFDTVCYELGSYLSWWKMSNTRVICFYNKTKTFYINQKQKLNLWISVAILIFNFVNFGSKMLWIILRMEKTSY